MLSKAQIENKYVKEVYKEIATHFSDTRYCVWDMVNIFLNKQKNETNGIEIGCGNGKNLNVNKKVKIIGIDNCTELIKICKEKKLEVILADCCKLPFNSYKFDFALSIAVFHHLASDDRRLNAISEMIRILKIDGLGIISVWSLENQENEKKKRKFEKGDNIVLWHRKSDNKKFNRYYYIYDYLEITKLFCNFNNINIIDVYNQRGNWVIEFKKIM